MLAIFRKEISGFFSSLTGYIVIIVFLVVFLGTVIYTFSQDKVYTSETQILIDDSMSSGNVFDQMTPFKNTDLVINNEIQIITSRRIAELTINSLIIDYPLDSLYLFDKGLFEVNKSISSRFRKSLKKMLGRNEDFVLSLEDKKTAYISEVVFLSHLDRVRLRRMSGEIPLQWQ
jgi:uncharacterized protein involved in exopolysaccharide biosynthesis